MKLSDVKQHTRKSKSGKLEVVKKHLRSTKEKSQVNKEIGEKKVATAPIRLDKKFIVGIKIRRPEEEKVQVSKKRKKVIPNIENPEILEEEYKAKYPITWEVMSAGKWITKKTDDGKKVKEIVLPREKYNELVRENEQTINSVAKKYAFGQSFGDRFEEMRSIALLGFVEAVNYYGNIFDAKNPPNLKKIIYNRVHNRLHEYRNNRLKAGLRIPANLQKPYYEYLEIKNKFAHKGIHNPTDEQLAKELQKIWNKESFYPGYTSAEGRKYKVKKKFVTGFKNKKKIVETRLVEGTFSDLSERRKEEERRKDRLPMEGYITLLKEGTVKNKEVRHKENIEEINKKTDEELRKLEIDYQTDKTITPRERKLASDFIKDQESRLGNLEKKHVFLTIKKTEAMKLLEKEQARVKDKITMLILKKNTDASKLTPKEKKNLSIDLRNEQAILDNLSSVEFLNKTVIPFNKDIVEIEAKIKKANIDLQIAKDFYAPFDEEKYKKKKEEIQARNLVRMQDETRRYNKDVSSSNIPGVKERLREFKALESIINVPLNAPIGEDDSTTAIDTLIMRPEELSPQELNELIDLHTVAKNELKDKINSLNPIYRDVFSLYIGLHDESPPTKDNLWGELATYKNIIKYLDEKHANLLKNPRKTAEWISGKSISKEERKLYLNSLPYVLPEYRDKPDLFLKRNSDWLKRKPKANKVKIKIKRDSYKKLYKKYRKAKIKSYNEWTSWRRKNDFTQKQSKKKYLEIKEKNRALRKYKPKRFITVTRDNTYALRKWRTKEPKLFYNSDSGKERFVRSVLDTSIDIMRTPGFIKTQVIRDLLGAHRKLIDNGVSISKAIENKFANINFDEIVKEENDIEIIELENE